MLQMRLVLLSLPVLLVLTACPTLQTRSTAVSKGDATRVACESFEPIYYSASKDTPETVVKIKEHNAVYQALCSKYLKPTI